ncbi:MAG: hypothetical protein Q4B47_01725 [Eubacteriales bacterium]|nr:hypothetical protein [Eubacteriales bacterium]
MKKRYLMIAGLMAACMVTSGCGKKEQAADTTETQVTVAPAETTTQTVTPTPSANSNLVNMQKNTTPTAAPDKNVIGNKTATASKVQIINKTGLTIAKMYIRPNVADGSEWGEQLLGESLKLNNNDLATYYCEKTAVNEDGDNVSAYDIYIICSDEDESEFYFRKLPLGEMSSVTLMLDGKGDDSIPYATYLLQGSSKSVSTLQEVKERLGRSDSDDSKKDEETNSDNNNDNSNSSDNQNQNQNDSGEQTDVYSDEANDAKTYIGLSKDELFSGMGEPDSSSVEDQEDGKTGYYYYNGYTVSTSIDEEGNEVVTNVM